MKAIHRLLIATAGLLVPRRMRDEWRAEWEAEILAREETIARWPEAHGRRAGLLRSIFGAFADAVWLRSSHWHSTRFLMRHWRLSSTAILSLGAGTLAVVVGLGVTNALLFRPPGVGAPERLVSIYVGPQANPYGSVSFPEFSEYRAGNHVFTDVAAYPQSITEIELTTAGGRQHVVATEVSSNYFSALDVAPALGSLAFPDDSTAQGDGAVISYRLWERLGSPPEIVGSAVKLNGTPVSVLGVAPPTFGRMWLVWEPDVWITLGTSERVLGVPPSQLTDRRLRWLHMVGRLRPGVSPAQATSDLRLLAARLAADNPVDAGRAAMVKPATTIPAADRGWVSLLAGALIVIVFLLFAATCANVASLLLGLSIERRHDMLVRAALGASRRQLMMPAIRESMLLAVTGGGLGLAAGYAALMKLSALRPSLGPSGFPAPSVDVRADASVAVATIAIVIACGVAIAAFPAWRAVEDGISPGLASGRHAGSRRAGRARGALVIAQMAIATLVLVGVGVSIRSLVNLKHTALGFSARNIAFWGVSLGAPNRLGPELYERIRERVSSVPGVDSLSLSDSVPLLGSSARDFVLGDGETPGPDGHGFETAYAVVDHNYFDLLGFTKISGRTFDAHDLLDTPEVVVVNETLARRHWPARNAVGRRLHIEDGRRAVQVIGVVADSKYDDLADAAVPFMYFSLDQHAPTNLIAIARTRGPAAALLAPVAGVLREFDPGNPSPQWVSGTLDDLMALSLFVPRAIALTIGGLGALTAMLAIVGLYGTVFYSIGQRKHEIGIRVALGAQSRDVFRLVLGYSGMLALAGGTMGVLAGAATIPAIAGVFYGIDGVQPAVLIAVAGLVALTTIATSYLAARPWIRLSPMEMVRGG